MDCPSTLPLSQIWSNLPMEKEQRYLQNSSTYGRRTLPFNKILQEASPVWGFKTSTAQQIVCWENLLESFCPLYYRACGKTEWRARAGSWRNTGWVRLAENQGQRFRGRYSLCRRPGRRLLQLFSWHIAQTGLKGEFQPCEFMSELHHQAHATLVFASRWLIAMHLKQLIHLQKVRSRT